MAISLRTSAALVAMFLMGLLTQSLFSQRPVNSTTSMPKRNVEHQQSLDRVLESLNKTLGVLAMSRNSQAAAPAAEHHNAVAVDVNFGNNELISEVKNVLGSMKKVMEMSLNKASLDAAASKEVRKHATVVSTVPTTPAVARREIHAFVNEKCLDTNAAYRNNSIKVYACNQGYFPFFLS
jgi:hypothetical protein